MKKIGIVVCNYNKREYVINCVHSIFKQTLQDFDVYVVDNASPDDSVAELKKEFGNSICLIENQNNLGGSGGFNTGLREALKKDYEYLMLVDNDIIMDERAVEELSIFLNQNGEVGMVGSEIYKMDQPNTVMALGSIVDYEKYQYEDCYRGCHDSDDIPEVNDCDYVPACSMMVRTEAVRKVGVMTESNFIYWDDIDWAKRMQLAGYKIAAITKSKIWHKGGAMRVVNTFQIYYNLRNGIRFFSTYLSEKQLEHYVDTMLDNIYAKIYGCYSKGKYNYIQSLMQAYDDALHGITGKAGECKILPMTEENNTFRKYIESGKKIIIELTEECKKDEFKGIRLLTEYIEKTWDNIEVTLSTQRCLDLSKCIRKTIHETSLKNIKVIEVYNSSNYDIVMSFCEHVKSVEKLIHPIIYLDAYTNVVRTEEELIYFKGYQTNCDLFKRSQRELFYQGIKRIQEEKACVEN